MTEKAGGKAEDRNRLNRAIEKMLSAPRLAEAVRELRSEPARVLIKALLPLLCEGDEERRRRAALALGEAVARLFDEDAEAGRTMMRRLLWSLNDESGGIGWGAPETLAQAMIAHEGLAREFSHLLVSFIVAEGNFLDHEPLLRGAVWGIGALARKRPDAIKEAEPHLIALLSLQDAEVRALSAWALAELGGTASVAALQKLVADETLLQTRLEGGLRETTVGEQARRALAAVSRERTERMT